MTDRYEALRKAAEAATPGPWFINSRDRIGPKSYDDDQSFGMILDVTELSNGKRADKDFISLANPAAILELLAERDALAAQVEALKVDGEFWKDRAADLHVTVCKAWACASIAMTREESKKALDRHRRIVAARAEKEESRG